MAGVAICAHIDRTSNSVLSNLGFVPPQAGFATLELSKNGRRDAYGHLGDYRFISNSDAHYLPDISERVNFLELEDKNVENLLEILRKKQNFV